jgi:hypothetical protein
MTKGTKIVDWLNVPLYRSIRRIDPILVLLGILCMLYYYLTTSSLYMALLGGATFGFVALIALL